MRDSAIVGIVVVPLFAGVGTAVVLLAGVVVGVSVTSRTSVTPGVGAIDVGAAVTGAAVVGARVVGWAEGVAEDSGGVGTTDGISDGMSVGTSVALTGARVICVGSRVGTRVGIFVGARVVGRKVGENVTVGGGTAIGANVRSTGCIWCLWPSICCTFSGAHVHSLRRVVTILSFF